MKVSMRTVVNRIVTERLIERPLSRYVDAEVGPLGRLYVHQILRVSRHAQLYRATLQSMAKLVSERHDQDHAPVDLWGRIEQGIRQQRYEAVFTRQPVRPTWAKRLGQLVPPQIRWGMSGAAVATAFALFLSLPGGGSRTGDIAGRQESGGDRVARSVVARGDGVAAVPVRQVVAGGSARDLRAVSAMERDGLELQWLRSKGAVKMIRVPEDGASIIWVKRRDGEGASRRRSARVGPTRDPYADLLTMFSEDQGPNSRASEGSFETRVPQAIPVGGR